MKRIVLFFLAVCAISAGVYFLPIGSIAGAPVAQQQANAANISAGAKPLYNASLINNSINQTREYIQTVNRSAYLVFYPNLSLAQNYLNKSISLQANATMPAQEKAAGIYALLAKAKSSAYEQQAIIYRYRAISFKAVAVALLGALFILYFISSMGRRRTAQGKKQTKKAMAKTRH
ncbi:MAG: hypothetical protein M1331_03130 [Candidatus Marsarchaeota archaeon]|nr:hypothetical protein [Candidatus Marsarchaeota archaeon]MCL5106359.1 hypothetical protein [Candidatus Marsarchaeota archaeon]